MLGPLLLLQLATAAPRPSANYATPALARFIAAAAAANRAPPPSLDGYRAHIESELSLILRDTLGREHIAQVEQVALESRWQRPATYDLHVVGYRSASVGVPYSALSFARSWTVPFLYGDRLTLGVDVARPGAARNVSPARAGNGGSADSSLSRKREVAPIRAVHPLASDRDRFYRFAGGDTIAYVRSGTRVVPIVEVRVRPTLDSVPSDSSLSAFEGEIDFDATRHQIVRMRGRFVTRLATQHGLRAALAKLPGVVAVAFVEFVNVEVDGRYWLPQFQRTEFQASVSALGGQRSLFRLLSRFDGITTTESGVAAADTETVDSSAVAAEPNANARLRPAARPALTYAGGDSVSRFSHWLQPLGAFTASVSAADFDDFLPDAWRASGPPRLEFAPSTVDQVFRYDRIEGAYTGAALRLRLRNAAPGLSATAYGGWAWTEETARGGAAVRLARGTSAIEVRVERLLVSTNDFEFPLEGGTIGFGALLGADPADYIDRRTAALSLTSASGSVQEGVVTIQAGLGEDRGESARLSHALFDVGGRFRLNRGSADGRYVRGAASIEWHPDVTGLFLEPGAGFVASYEIAHGQLSWERAELAGSMRKSVSNLTVAARIQGGAVVGHDIPPQQLFEMGGTGVLPGYGYKEFAGDRAATAGVLVSYAFPLLRRPRRLVRSLVIPGLGPGLAAGLESGWTEASSAAAWRAIRRLDPLSPPSCIDDPSAAACPAPLSVPTGRIRATLDARLTLFGGLLGLGIARPIDTAARWRLVFRFGQEY